MISGLVRHIPLEEMQNRMVVLLCNLKPAKMRGIVSEAMVMCASTPDKVEILAPPEGAVPGDLVTVTGYEGSTIFEIQNFIYSQFLTSFLQRLIFGVRKIGNSIFFYPAQFEFKKINLGKPDEVIKPTNKKQTSVFELVAPDLKTDENCNATYKVHIP